MESMSENHSMLVSIENLMLGVDDAKSHSSMSMATIALLLHLNGHFLMHFFTFYLLSV